MIRFLNLWGSPDSLEQLLIIWYGNFLETSLRLVIFEESGHEFSCTDAEKGSFERLTIYLGGSKSASQKVLVTKYLLLACNWQFEWIAKSLRPDRLKLWMTWPNQPIVILDGFRFYLFFSCYLEFSWLNNINWFYICILVKNYLIFYELFSLKRKSQIFNGLFTPMLKIWKWLKKLHLPIFLIFFNLFKYLLVLLLAVNCKSTIGLTNNGCFPGFAINKC